MADALAEIIRAPETAKQTGRKIRVRQLIERDSSLALGNTDPELNAAIRFIQENYAEDLGIDDIVASTQLSRRSLETRFKQILQRSILQELQNKRIQVSQGLLTSSAYTVTEIATMCGFKHTRNFCKLFKEKTKKTPLDYRKSYSEDL